MLSRKVACAIIILNELYCTSPDIRTGNKSLRRATLLERSSPDSRTFRRVMQQLYSGKYIDMASSSVILTCDPMELTIYDLFMVFHGGIPLGEEQDIVLESSHYARKGYPTIELLQQDAAEVSRKYFNRLTVASMINVQIKKRTK